MTQPPPWGEPPAPQANPYTQPGDAYPQGGPYAPAGPSRPPTQPRGLSITAFVLGLLGCVPLGSLAAVVLGVVALVKRQALRGLAVAGIVLGLLWTIGGVAFFATGAASRIAESVQEAVDGVSSPGESGTGPGGETIESSDLRLGDCFNDPGALGLAPDEEFISDELERLPCEEPHAFEVYHVTDIAGSEYPGEEAVLAEVEQACIGAFDEFVGLAFQESVVDVIYYYPTPRTWDSLGDRSVICAVTAGGSTTDSLEDANR